MGKKHLKLGPQNATRITFDGDMDAWWYEENGGIVVIVERRDEFGIEHKGG